MKLTRIVHHHRARTRRRRRAMALIGSVLAARRVAKAFAR